MVTVQLRSLYVWDTILLSHLDYALISLSITENGLQRVVVRLEYDWVSPGYHDVQDRSPRQNKLNHEPHKKIRSIKFQLVM